MKKFFRVDPQVDDAGLSTLQFRLLGHLARLSAGKGGIESSISEMAAVCGVAPNTIKIALRDLRLLNIIATETCRGKVPQRRINSPSVWKIDQARKTGRVGKRPGPENGAAPRVESTEQTRHQGGQTRRAKKLADCQREGILPNVL